MSNHPNVVRLDAEPGDAELWGWTAPGWYYYPDPDVLEGPFGTEAAAEAARANYLAELDAYYEGIDTDAEEDDWFPSEPWGP